MAKAKMLGKGTVLTVDKNTVPVAVGFVISMTGPGPAAETYDGSTFDQSGDGKPKPITGYVDSGELSFEMFFDAADTTDQELLELAMGGGDGDGCDWKITYATSDTLAWTGAGVSFNQTIAMNDGVKATVTCAVNGSLTFTDVI